MQISQGNLYKNIKSQLPDLKGKGLQHITSYVGLLFGLSFADGKISKKEVYYIKKNLKNFPQLNSHHIDLLSDIGCFLVEKDPHFFDFKKSYQELLKLELDNKQKLNLIEGLFMVARGDLDISIEEIVYIKDLADYFELTEGQYEASKATAEVILSQKLGEDFSQLHIVHGKDKFEL